MLTLSNNSFTHNIPTTLIENTKADPSAHDQQYMNTYVSFIKPILMEHMSVAFAASQSECCICNSPATSPSMTPMSWLHCPDPFISIMVCPICSKPSCDTLTRQNIQQMMAKMAGSGKVPGADRENKKEQVIGEIMPCKVCKTLEKTIKCARCKVAFYCGKEHQVEDSPRHKRECEKATRDFLMLELLTFNMFEEFWIGVMAWVWRGFPARRLFFWREGDASNFDLEIGKPKLCGLDV